MGKRRVREEDDDFSDFEEEEKDARSEKGCSSDGDRCETGESDDTQSKSNKKGRGWYPYFFDLFGALSLIQFCVCAVLTRSKFVATPGGARYRPSKHQKARIQLAEGRPAVRVEAPAFAPTRFDEWKDFESAWEQYTTSNYLYDRVRSSISSKLSNAK